MDIAMAYSALTAAFQLAKGLKDVHDQVEINEIVIELQGRIMEAQEAVRDGKDRLSALESELTALKDWKQEAERYRLVEFGSGRFCYEVRAEKQDDEPFHRICPSCFNKNQKAILQFRHRATVGEVYFCPNCSTEFHFGEKSPSPSVNRGRSYGF